MKRPSEEFDLRLIAVYMTVPFVLALPPLIGLWIGSHLDTALGTSPWLMIALLLLGLVAGARELWRLIRTFGAD